MKRSREVFGSEISALVDGLTKISRITFEEKLDHEAENFRKMILAMGKDIRVILIKLADRLHNMRTLGALQQKKQKEIARETLDIYAPIANRLGIGWMKAELEDLSFKHLESKKYKALKEKVSKLGVEREEYMSKVRQIIEDTIQGENIKCEVTGRLKHVHSIYRKMIDQDLDFESIHDLIAFRVTVDSIRNCYSVLGIIHSAWKPVPGRFKDYIAIPKPNMYQSLHTTVFGPEGDRMEVQIRTKEMHKVAEYGIATHWKYKEGTAVDDRHDKGFAWVKQLLEWQRDLDDSSEFLDILKVDLFPEEVFVFTPNGDVKELPVGATPVDFAYDIHTDIGHRCSGAKVNGRNVSLKHRLKNGDIVEIRTSKNHRPSKDWLNFVVTSKARARIRQQIKAEERKRSIVLGKEICEKAFVKYDLDFKELVKSGKMEMIASKEFGFQDVNDLAMNVGYGKVPVIQILSKILPPEKLSAVAMRKASPLRRVFDRFKPRGAGGGTKSGVVIKGVEDTRVRFAMCCNPLPGDEIVGFISHGHGVTIHAAACRNLLSIDPERRVDVNWGEAVEGTRAVRIKVISKNEKGLLAGMSNAINKADANIAGAQVRIAPRNRAVNIFEVEVSDLEQLKNIVKLLKKVKGVLKVERVKPLGEE